MAKDKNSFVLYKDLLHTIEKMPAESAGELFLTILQYVNDLDPNPENLIVNISFEPIRRQLKRDLKKWQKSKKARSDAGKKGMKTRWGADSSGITKDNKAYQTITNDNNVINPITNITVSGSVNGNVNDNVTVIYDAEAEILKNPIWLEKMGVKHHRSLSEVTEILHTYHLYLEEKEQYPRGKKACFSGFEKWLINEKKFNNGSKTNSVSNRHAGAAQLIAIMRKDAGE